MNHDARVLVVEDDAAVRHVLLALLEQEGFSPQPAESAERALEQLRSGPFDLVVTDLRLGGMDGMQLLRQVAREWPEIPVVMLTAHGTVEGAVEAMKAGAADYMLKPFDREEVLYTVRKTLAGTRAKQGEPPPPASSTGELVGDSGPMRDLAQLLARAATTHATVLLRGESGTGKELCARSIHERSPRAQRPFIVVNCGALPEHLLESELFGYEKGAFTGAASRKPGRVALAEGGTLFLDEIGELPASMQVKLLRLIQSREYEPLGSTKVSRADVRFVAATHRNLEEMIRVGTFREDLYYRLNVLPIWIAPLRERRVDIPLLVEHFCRAIAERDGRPDLRFSVEALALLASEPWPGNVRQLQNFVERSAILSEQLVISAEVVRKELCRSEAAGIRSLPTEVPAGASANLEETRALAEREAVALALHRASGNRTAAARILGVSRRTLYNKLAEYGLT
jgi:DNA-binding NtrC family response regulator